VVWWEIPTEVPRKPPPDFEKKSICIPHFKNPPFFVYSQIYPKDHYDSPATDGLLTPTITASQFFFLTPFFAPLLAAN